MKRLGIYSSIGPAVGHFVDDYQLHALTGILPVLDAVHVVTGIEEGTTAHGEVSAIATSVFKPRKPFLWTGEGYRDALSRFSAGELAGFDEVMLFDASFFGPIFPIKEIFAAMADKSCDYWSATYFDTKLDRRFKDKAAAWDRT